VYLILVEDESINALPGKANIVNATLYCCAMGGCQNIFSCGGKKLSYL
jgi:hypothetical protein